MNHQAMHLQRGLPYWMKRFRKNRLARKVPMTLLMLLTFVGSYLLLGITT